MRKNKGFTLIELLIVVAIIAILAAIAVPNFLEAQVRSKVSRVKADQRSLATALESYYIDNNAYPATDSSSDTLGTGTTGFGVNSGLVNISGQLKNMPTFRRKANGGDQLHTITTPISYITSIFGDAFAATKNASFYYSTPSFTINSIEARNSGWIVWSPGPDFDERIQNTAHSGGGNGGTDLLCNDVGLEQTRIGETIYNPLVGVPRDGLNDRTYDPTNGTTSEGDVWRAKQ